jgi:hypothetical protein
MVGAAAEGAGQRESAAAINKHREILETVMEARMVQLLSSFTEGVLFSSASTKQLGFYPPSRKNNARK